MQQDIRAYIPSLEMGVSNPGISDDQSATMEALLRQMDIYIGTHKEILDYTRTRLSRQPLTTVTHEVPEVVHAPEEQQQPQLQEHQQHRLLSCP